MKRGRVILATIIIIAIVLRLTNLGDRFPFSGEVGDNLLDIKAFHEAKVIPLVGPPTSHPWLYFGPLYYWLIYPLWLALNHNPISVAYFGLITSVFLVMFNYLIIKKIKGENTALISSLVIAVSPLWIEFSVASRFYFLSVFTFYAVLYYLHLFIHKKDKALYLLAFFFGLSFNFHYSVVLFIPVIAYFWYLNKIKSKLTYYLKALALIILANAPLVIYDAKNNMIMTKNLVMWFPYRIAGFLRIYPKNNPTGETLFESLKTFVWVVGRVLTDNYFIGLGIVLLSIAIIYRHNKLKNNFLIIFCFALTIVSLVGAIIHGSIPAHYLLPIFPVSAVIIAEAANIISKSARIGLIALVLIVNFSFYRNIFNLKSISAEGFVPLGAQYHAAKVIINNVNNKDYSLARVGPWDHFEENYAQNYRYLLWYLGNEPKENSSQLYIICEDECTGHEGITIYPGWPRVLKNP